MSIDPSAPLSGATVAGPADAAAITATVTAAFATDPTWAWAVGGSDPTHLGAIAKLWRLLVDGAMPFDWIWQLPAAAAMTLWIPPGGTELPPEVAADLDAFLQATFGPTADRVQEIFTRFEQARPHDVPHYYLSLLATNPEHRGHGLGLDLLRHNLSLVDEIGLPSYLESTNPANLTRYARIGFEPRDEFRLGHDGPLVTTMWRVVGGERA